MNKQQKQHAAEMIARFPKGARVTLARVKHEGWRGCSGTVRQYVKCRGSVTVEVDGKGHYNLYDAMPENLDVFPPEDEVGICGRCDTCGAPCDLDGCTADRAHAIARL